MMRPLRRALAIMSLTTGAASAQAPNTDIFLAPLSRVGDSIVVGAAINITHRPGYDNQPGFLLDSRALLYTVVGTDGQADIWRYDIARRRTTQVTRTRESEYSATAMPGGKRFSTIRVELDSTQRLWSFALDGSDPHLVLADLKPVGYHAWLGDGRLVTFVLGKPSTLHVISRDGSHDDVRASDIGRAIHRIPGKASYSFTQRDSTRAYLVMSQPIAGGAPMMLVPAAADNEYHAWTPAGRLLSVTNDVLVRWNGATGAASAWIPVASLAHQGAAKISRLAVSPNGRWLAFVAEPVTP